MERRCGQRYGMLHPVDVLFDRTRLLGVVLNLSTTGARIVLPSSPDVPETVTLLLPDSVTRIARRCWQLDDEAGFEFLPSAVASAINRTTRAAPTHP
ncbi:PilZ domain-containing protein [Belnapia moabensis]|uniref:PilZ domain-containing protein n=1 Tax=Belnapia moabensis TaxID=365533 RepID=UPI0009FF47A0